MTHYLPHYDKTIAVIKQQTLSVKTDRVPLLLSALQASHLPAKPALNVMIYFPGSSFGLSAFSFHLGLSTLSFLLTLQGVGGFTSFRPCRRRPLQAQIFHLPDHQPIRIRLSAT
jgi:hypothetical protein